MGDAVHAHQPGGGAHLVHGGLRAARGCEEARAVESEDVGVHGAGFPDRPDPGRVSAVEDREVPGETSFDRLVVDDVGGVEALLRLGREQAVDLDREDGPIEGHSRRGVLAGQRAFPGRRRPGRRGGDRLARACPPGGGPLPSGARGGRQRHDDPDRDDGSPGRLCGGNRTRDRR